MSGTIGQLLKDPEGKTLEFKQNLSSPLPILKTLVAFANTAGGKLILGVTDERNLVGVEDPLAGEERLCNLIVDSIVPRLVPSIELTTVNDKTLLVVEVFLSGTRPHFIKSRGLDNGVYVRLGSTNRQADAHLVAELQRGSAGISYDALPMLALSKDDLDIHSIAEDFSEKKINDAFLQSLKILTREQNRLVPTHGGILLYGQDRRLHFDDAWVQCGRFMGEDKSDIFDQQDITGTMPAAVENIMLFLKKHAMRGADFSEMRRKDLWSIPIDILREVVINALVHADYSQRGAPIRIAFFDNRIEVENPGLLMPGLTIEDMKQGISKIRNSVIARVFKELKYIEQWGSGIPGIFRKIEEEKLPPPKIEELGVRVRFTVYLKDILPLSTDQSRKGTGAPVEAPVEAPVDLSDTDVHILQALAWENLGRSRLLAKLGYTQRTGSFKKAIAKLLETESIEMTIPDKPNSRLQKYRITPRGRTLLKGNKEDTE